VGRLRVKDPRCLDLIGLEVVALDCAEVRGVVVGETENTFLVMGSDGEVRTLLKAPCTILVIGDRCMRIVRGAWLVGYRDERLFRCLVGRASRGRRRRSGKRPPQPRQAQ